MDEANVASRERTANARALRAFLREVGEPPCEYLSRRTGIAFARASAIFAGASPNADEAERIARMMREGE